MKKIIIIGLAGLAISITLYMLIGSVNVKVEPKIDANPKGLQKIKIPAHEEIIEIERKNGRPPFRIHRKVPDKEITIDNKGAVVENPN